MTTAQLHLTAAQTQAVNELTAEHGAAYWPTAQQFEGVTATGLSISFASGYGFIITEQGVKVAA